MNELPRAVRISEVVEESDNVKTIFLDTKIDAKPGQFIMVWLPGVNEKPFSLSYIEKPAITVLKKGKFTEKLHELRESATIGIRGPYGNAFPLLENACVVAGGVGIASLAPLIEQLKDPTVIIAAKTKEEVIFKNRLKKTNLYIATDDGSEGFQGFATDLLSNLIKENKFSAIYTCGPEVMMKKVLEIAGDIKCYASLERYMKCGLGICGQCCVSGFRVCKDGPIFDSSQLKRMEEFGNTARLKSGKKVPLKEFAEWRSK